MITINVIEILKWYSIIFMVVSLILCIIDYTEQKDIISNILAISLTMPIIFYLIIS